MPWLASMPSPWWYMAPSIVPLMQYCCPVPLAAKHPQSIMFPPLCFTLGMVFLGSKAAFHLLQKWQVESMPKSLNLVSSDHKTFIQFSSQSFRCSLANFRRACTCAFLSRGTLWALHDCNCFLGDYGPRCLTITRSSCVVLGWFLTFSWSLKLHEVRSCMEPQTEGDWQLFCVSSICK